MQKVSDWFPGRGGDEQTADRTLPAYGDPLDPDVVKGDVRGGHVIAAVVGILALVFVWGRIGEKLG
jgi:hypothetical protein